ncbi:hypothetical protein V8E54_011456 [Elaphomyces granulatus]
MRLIIDCYYDASPSAQNCITYLPIFKRFVDATRTSNASDSAQLRSNDLKGIHDDRYRTLSPLLVIPRRVPDSAGIHTRIPASKLCLLNYTLEEIYDDRTPISEEASNAASVLANTLESRLISARVIERALKDTNLQRPTDTIESNEDDHPNLTGLQMYHRKDQKIINNLSGFRLQPVFKQGRTTGTTAGYAEIILADLRIDEWPPGMTHQAVLISNWPKSSPTDIPNTFADHGDSGSWVLNNGGDLVGIVTSGSHYRHSSSTDTDTVAYMISFEALNLTCSINSIK